MRRLVWWLAMLLWCGCAEPGRPEPDGGVSVVDAGCPAGTLGDATGACVAVGPACGPGFVRDDSGFGCAPVLATCGPGQLSVPGEPCAPIGWQACPAGFSRAADGWSCEPVLPTVACQGATRAALGGTTCVPVGDCDAPFPPPAATLFVDAALPQPDATHFRTIGAAVAAAPAGATIAIAPGTYRESVTVPRAMRLVGRCAAQVTLTGDPALFVDGVTAGVDVEGLTVRDSLVALRVERGAKVGLRHAVLEGNKRSGVQALDPGTEVTLEDVVLRDLQADPATASFGQGAAASFGAALVLRDVEVRGALETGVFLDREATRGTLRRVVISDISPRASTGKLGWGIGVQRGAALDAAEVVVQRATLAGVALTVAPTSATLRDLVVRETRVGVDSVGGSGAYGVSVSAGASVTWSGGAVASSPGVLVHAAGGGTQLSLQDVTVAGGQVVAGVVAAGVSVEDRASATLTRVAVRAARLAGVRALDGDLRFEQLGVFDTAGSGLWSQGGRVTGVALMVSGHEGVGALARDDGTLTLTRCLVEKGRTEKAAGLGAQAALLVAQACAVRDVVAAGVYVRGAGALDGVRVFENEVGLHAQDDSIVEEVAVVPDALGARQVAVSASTVFEANRAKLSSSTVPVPPP